MKTENMQKLVTALRSGEFKQANGKLNRIRVSDYIQEAIDNDNLKDFEDDPAQTVGHCCLGVACELAVQEGVLSRSIVSGCDDGELVSSYGEHGDENFLPHEVAAWLGLPSDQRDLYFDLTDRASTLDLPFYAKEKLDRHNILILRASDLNDQYNFTFEMIADLIENGKMVPLDEIPFSFR